MIFSEGANNLSLETVLQALAASEYVAIDTETNSVNKRQAVCIGISLATKTNAFYICLKKYCPTTKSLTNTSTTPEMLQPLWTMLRKKQLLTWNGAFDVPIIKNNFGIDLRHNMHIDGMLLYHTLDENRHAYGLKEIGASVFGSAAASEQQDLKQEVQELGGRWTKENKEMYMASPSTLAKYAIKDARLTYDLVLKALPELKKQNLEQFFLKDEVMPLYRLVTIPMEERGLRLNTQLLQSTAVEIANDISKLECEILSEISTLLEEFNRWWMNKEYKPSREGAFAQGICALANLPLPKTATGKYSLTAANIAKLPDSRWKAVLEKKERLTEEEVHKVQQLLWEADGCPKRFLLTSKHHLKKLFFEQLQEKPLSYTEKGSPQVDDHFLQKMRTKHPWCELLHVFNKLNKISGTYVNGILEQQENGIFYPNFFQHRTVSGRYGSNLQQLPKLIEDQKEHELVLKYTNRIRRFFISRDSHQLIDADYESLEPHVFSCVAKEPKIQAIFHKNHDFYSTIAIDTEKLQGVSADKAAPNYLGTVNKAKRNRAKVYCLGIPYGLGGFKLQFELNITLQEAEALVKGYLEAYPSLAQWMKDSERFALTHGYIKSEAGRIRRFPRLVQIYKKYGDCILDDLALWEQLHETPGLYNQAKKDRRELKNYLNNAKNFQIQSLAASIVNRAAISMAQEFEAKNIDAVIVAQIHDELLIEAANGHVEQAAEIMQHRMENAWKLPVTLKAKPEIGTVYGEIK